MGQIGEITRTREIPVPDRQPEPIPVPERPAGEPAPDTPVPAQRVR
jgi:hypothetical protein